LQSLEHEANINDANKSNNIFFIKFNLIVYCVYN
jgi:hypothetical protein